MCCGARGGAAGRSHGQQPEQDGPLKNFRTYGSFLSGLLQATDALAAGVLFFAGQAYGAHDLNLAAGVSVIIMGMMLVSMRSIGLYHSWRVTSLHHEILYIFRGCLGLYAALALGMYLLKLGRNFSAIAIIYWMVLLPFMISTGRILLRLSMRYWRTKGYNVVNSVIAGSGELAERLAGLIVAHPWVGIHLLGVFDDEDRAPPAGCRRLGPLSALPTFVQQQNVGLVYVVLPSSRRDLIDPLLAELTDSTVSVDFVPDIFTLRMIMGANIIYFGDLPIITLRETSLRGVKVLVKRIEDLVCASLFLLLAAPWMLLVAATIRWRTGGPALFRQWRYGYQGRPIGVWKFRSMTVAEDGYDFRAATSDDSRITRLGALLRRYSLDELPQLFNVLEGSMSIVGPRPHAVAMNEEFRKVVPGYMLRHKIKPGMTGLAQINGCRGAVTTVAEMQRRVEHDLEYLQHWSLLLDLRIIFKTLFSRVWITDAP